jgi:hypothetical protein
MTALEAGRKLTNWGAHGDSSTDWREGTRSERRAGDGPDGTTALFGASTSPSLAFSRVRETFLLLIALCALTVGACQSDRSAAAPDASAGAATVASPAQPSPRATRGDGVYAPVSNVELEQAIARDVAEIDQLMNAVAQGQSFPSGEILELYEHGKHARIGGQSRSLRGFATRPSLAREFPEDAGFYGSESFLDDSVIVAISGTGGSAALSPEQRRQAIQKGLLRILRYWSLQELVTAEPKLRAGNVGPIQGAPRDVDAAWAIYVGPESAGQYPFSLAAAARSLEENFGRSGTIDQPLRVALTRAQQAALQNSRPEFAAARTEVISRLNAIFYLETARDLTETARAAQAGDHVGAMNVQVAGYAAYLAIQPFVAIADPDADRTIVAVLRSEPTTLSLASRDEALGALNRVAGALGLGPADLLSPADFR